MIARGVRYTSRGMHRLIISAPFGNYIQPPGCTATLGTFTAQRRPGRVWRIIRTVRYYPRLGAWVNKIGLRNPGMDWLVARTAAGLIDPSDKIVSIHGFTEDEWRTLLDKAAALRPAPIAIELNMSCPNIGHVNWPAWLFARAAELRNPSPQSQVPGPFCIIKLPPVNYRDMFDQAIDAGIRAFHCCNTIPIPAGGVSGKPLKPVSLACIADIRSRAPAHILPRLTIIGGGGITTPADIDDYAAAGATHFAIATKVFNPKYLWSHAALQPLIHRANSAAPPPSPVGKES